MRRLTGLDEGIGHAECGVGFVADVAGRRSHRIVEQGIRILENLVHRGACGCDPETGDGAGVLVQVPHDMLQAAMDGRLPPPGGYGAGMVFLPWGKADREVCEAALEAALSDRGLSFLGWRDVPVDPSAPGGASRAVMPVIRQCFAGAPAGMADDELERRLFVARKAAERTVAGLRLAEGDRFYVCSLSARTLVYKGLLLAHQIARFYRDLSDPSLASAVALVHQRFSTNTFPSWRLAHPYRMLAHNGEINTLRGNRNWMRAREARLRSPLFGDDVARVLPLVSRSGSDSEALDNALELLVRGGRSLAHAVMMLIPEALGPGDDPERVAFYDYHACSMEPWDGPATLAFTDGRCVGAARDRNGLRPARWMLTRDGLVVMASEAGVLDIPPADVVRLGNLEAGRKLLVDTAEGRLIADEEIERHVVRRRPYREWLAAHRVTLADLPAPAHVSPPPDSASLEVRRRAFGYTLEDLRLILVPMASTGQEPVGSMGDDTPMAVLSERSRLLYDYFRQLFAQVTNPPIDPIREALVTSLATPIGVNGSLLDETPEHCRQIRLESPILLDADLERLRLAGGAFPSRTLSALFDPSDGAAGLEAGVGRLCREASAALAQGTNLIVISDRGVRPDRAPIPPLLAVSAVHQHLVREGDRTNVALVVESGEPREVMHFALLVGLGASAVNPWLAIATIEDLARRGVVPGATDPAQAVRRYIHAIDHGLLKTMSKMGISTLLSYRGAQIFEAVGLDRGLVERHFTGIPSRIGGAGMDVIAAEVLARHADGWPPPDSVQRTGLDPGGRYQWRLAGEHHHLSPEVISRLQQACRTGSFEAFREYTALVDRRTEGRALRGLLGFRPRRPVPLGEVDSVEAILRRLTAGAMSLGSISREAHEAIAVALNRLGCRSNTGEGGEDPARSRRDGDGHDRRSAVRQVASARFGVTTRFLVEAEEIQIKIAQGAKPGEGGQLPGHKVDAYVAGLRHSVPGVTLISPPPHHDIYSIEDLAQLIHDLKCVNPAARVSVKLVSEAGVGTVAAGVVKAGADKVLVSGGEGGTGAAPLSSIKHSGLPWELGVAEAQQVLVENDLRGRVVLQTDGQLKTGRDIVVAALLGAEEFGFATSALVALGCVMMRVCHLNSCPAGVATQDPVLRSRFAGRPEHVEHLFTFLAREVREWMARLGFRTMDEMIGRADLLVPRESAFPWKARGVDLGPMLAVPERRAGVATRWVRPNDVAGPEDADRDLVEACAPALRDDGTVRIDRRIRNSHRSVGAMLAGEVTRRRGTLAPDSIVVSFRGSAGQSFGAFLVEGCSFSLEGDANDYLAKGMSGGRIAVFADRDATFVPRENVIAGNTVLYGATGGELYVSGRAGERFAVRNSGALAVVEGVGDHGCEYMTAGEVVVLGPVGRNFGAGMSGGIAWVLDEDGTLPSRVSRSAADLVLSPLSAREAQRVLSLVRAHVRHTASSFGREVIAGWRERRKRFVKVVSREYLAALASVGDGDGEAAHG